MKTWIIKYSTELMIAIMAVLSPITPILITVGILVGVDFIFAIYVAYKNKVKITSNKMSKTISKLLLYTITIICIFLLEKFIMGDVLPLSRVAATLIGVVELKSILENWEILFGWSLWDKMMSLVKRGASTTKDIIEEGDK